MPYHFVEKVVQKNTFDHQSIEQWSTQNVLKALRETEMVDPESTGDICGISQSATHRCIKEVTNALFQCANDFIYLPVDEDSQAERSAAFSATTHFPRVQGVIDSIHAAIRAPWDQPAVFVNRKDFHSLNVQLVCDHRRRIMNVSAHFPGSCHDSYILRNSQLPPVFEEAADVDRWILGDKGYPLCTWLMTPVHHPQSTAEKRYNVAHTSTRAIIDHSIGMLKMRFPFLDQRGNILQAEEQEEHLSSSDEDDDEEGKEEDNNDNDPVIDMRAMERHAMDIREKLIYARFSQQ
ncbi:putative nuclease HARBI1 [Heterodontus francisci]|uniref:putative nuclease HARBI1 n=1 Tax=Heterodontus francisci TaxID=7792 RepID=UPI00355BAB67